MQCFTFARANINQNTIIMEIGEQILMQYQAGRRSFKSDNLQQINLMDVKMPGVDMQEANLLWANMQSADLSAGKFKRAMLRGVNAKNAHLDHADFSEANMMEANFESANLQGAIFSKAQINTGFQYAKAAGADFSGATIESTNFQYADLSGATFCNARLDYVDFRHAILTGADFTGAAWGLVNYEGAATERMKNFTVISTNFDAKDPLEGKSEDFRKGYAEGYERGYGYAIVHPDQKETAWKKSLSTAFPAATSDFAAGYQLGFMQTYWEASANA